MKFGKSKSGEKGKTLAKSIFIITALFLAIGLFFAGASDQQEEKQEDKPTLVFSEPQKEDPWRKQLGAELEFYRRIGDKENAKKILDVLFPNVADIIIAEPQISEDIFVTKEESSDKSISIQWTSSDIAVMYSSNHEKHPWLTGIREDSSKLYLAAEHWNATSTTDKIALKKSDDHGMSWSDFYFQDSLYPLAQPKITQISGNYLGVVYTRAVSDRDNRLYFTKAANDFSEFDNVAIDTSTVDHRRAAIAVDYEDYPELPYIYLVYFEKIYNLSNITFKLFFRCSYDLGRSWSTPLLITSFDGPFLGDVDIDCSIEYINKNLYVAYTTWNGNNEDIAVVKGSYWGSSWSSPTIIASTSHKELYPIIAAIDPNILWIVYEYSSSSSNRDIRYAVTKNGGSYWYTNFIISNLAQDERYPSLAAYHGKNYAYCSYVELPNKIMVWRTAKGSPSAWNSLGNVKNDPFSAGDDKPGIWQAIIEDVEHVAVSWTESPFGNYDIFFDASWLPENINIPDKPSGPIVVKLGKICEFWTGGSSSNIGHSIQYSFDWGDGTSSSWLPVGYLNGFKDWTSPGTYNVKAQARCQFHHDVRSDWSTSLQVTTETVSTPKKPSGPTIVAMGKTYAYSTGDSSSSLGHNVQYLFDWGDGTNSDWLPVGTTSAPKSWSNSGTYDVQAKARCAEHTSVESDWSPSLQVTTERVSTPKKPSGPNVVALGKTYAYSTGDSSSSLGHNVQYFFDWGDGTSSDWLPVGTTSAPKSWSNSGTYNVQAKARCKDHPDVESLPSSVHQVTIEFLNFPPNTPSGPSASFDFSECTYSTGGTSTNLGHSIQYFFDWGDGTNSDWLPVGIASKDKYWIKIGTYDVKAKARCAEHTSVESGWSPILQVTIEVVTVPDEPSGPGAGAPGTSYTYSTGDSSTSLGHNVQYLLDWGDGTNSGWLPVGTTSAPKSWSNSGTYNVQAKARCQDHTPLESGGSPPLQVTIEVVTVPDEPSGPGTGAPGTSYTYSTGDSSTSLAHNVQYLLDWGDGTNSGWLPVGTTSAPKSWSNSGTYNVQAKARCQDHTPLESDWSPILQVTIEVVTVPDEPSGPGAGAPGTSYTYSTGDSSTSLGHNVQYLFDWGDGTNSGWLPVGTTSAPKSWSNSGTYNVQAKARCQDHTPLESDWSPILQVTIEVVTVPDEPSGPGAGAPGTSYTYSTGDSSTSLSHIVQYLFDWGDGTNSGWLPVGTASASKSWTTAGTYNVTARARCETHPTVESGLSTSFPVTIETVSAPSSPSGPSTGTTGITYIYSTGGSVSSAGHPVQYIFYWGDGTDSGWLAVGTTSASKSWSTAGTYDVTAKARCATDTAVESSVSAGQQVTILQIPILSVAPSYADVGYNSGTTTFAVSNTGGGNMNWTASIIEGNTWLTIQSGASGTNNGTISLAFQANPGINARTAKVRVTAPSASGSPKDVSVTQAGSPPPNLALQAQRLDQRAWIIRIEYAKVDLTVSRSGPVQVDRYVLLRRMGSQGYGVLREFNESDIQNNKWTYIDKNLNRSMNYAYRIEARAADGSLIAQSNEVALQASRATPPQRRDTPKRIIK